MVHEAFPDVIPTSSSVRALTIPFVLPGLTAMLLCLWEFCSFGCNILPPLVNLVNLIPFKTQLKIHSPQAVDYFLVLSSPHSFVTFCLPLETCLLLKLLLTTVTIIYHCNYSVRAGANLFSIMPGTGPVLNERLVKKWLNACSPWMSRLWPTETKITVLLV